MSTITASTQHSTTAPISRGRFWAGWILSLLPALMLITGGINAFRAVPMVTQGTAHLGYPMSILPAMGAIEIVTSLLFLLPATSVYGAILLTAFFGGATASHLRIGESTFFVPVAFGMIVWLALALRDPRVSSILTRRL